MSIKVAINGMGRIGRAALKIIMENEELNLVAVNDLVSADDLAYFLKYDSVYGKYSGTVKVLESGLEVNGHQIKPTGALVLTEKEVRSVQYVQ